MGPYDCLNLSLQALTLVVAIIMLMIDWSAPKRNAPKGKRRKPRKRR